jgi:hypothetical protein
MIIAFRLLAMLIRHLENRSQAAALPTQVGFASPREARRASRRGRGF